MSIVAPRSAWKLQSCDWPGTKRGVGDPDDSSTGLPAASIAKSLTNTEPVDDCELPPTPVVTKYSAPPFMSWVPARFEDSRCEMLPVSCWLLRCSGPVASKYAAWWQSRPGTV